MTRIAIVLIASLTLSGVTWAADGSEPLGTANDQAAIDEELLLWHKVDAYPMFGQLLDDDKPRGRQAAEAREEFEKQMQDTERKHHKRRKHLEQFRLLKLLELLDLDESQEVQFMKSFTSVRRELRRVDDGKREALDQLASGLHAGDIADDKIYDLLDKIVQIEHEKRLFFDHFLEESRSFLTAQQVAKLVIFHERFEYELLEKVKQFRDRPGGPGRPGRGPGPGSLSDG